MHFRVTTSGFTAPPSPFVVGSTITVDPCSIIVHTKGQLANDQCTTRNVQIQLGTVLSDPFPMTVCLSPTGNVTISGIFMGTISLVPLTGT